MYGDQQRMKTEMIKESTKAFTFFPHKLGVYSSILIAHIASLSRIQTSIGISQQILMSSINFFQPVPSIWRLVTHQRQSQRSS